MNQRTHESVRCHANSGRSGEPCKRWAIRGATVCPTHGGLAPQVRQSAALRLKALEDSAVDALEDLLQSEAEAIRLATARDVLDRAGHKPREKVDVTVQTVKALDAEAWESV